MSILSFLRRVKAILLGLVYGKKFDEVQLIYKLYSGKATGVMIDVGTHFGSSLLPFARKGWQIFGFEPDPNNRKKVLASTSNLKNVKIFEQAVSDVGGEELELFTSDVSTGISSLSKFHDSHQATAVVTTTTLKEIVSEHYIQKIDFLKIDAEGFDLFVLKGFDWRKHPHPEAILCEFEDKKTIALGYTVNDMCAFLIDKGYKLVISEWYPIQEYGQQHRWKRFVSSPQQITDSLAWGNIVATKPGNYSRLLQACKKYGQVADQ